MGSPGRIMQDGRRRVEQADPGALTGCIGSRRMCGNGGGITGQGIGKGPAMAGAARSSFHGTGKKLQNMTPFFGEFVGTGMLVILRPGVGANVVLQKTKRKKRRWIVISIGLALAVF